MAQYTTHDFDVLVIGAGGAGLRAAIESAALGAKTAVVMKSLLGKAHTVMAEGGAAAALRNADDRDSWETHFRDTMKGGKQLNFFRMAELHAKEAPDRIRELEEWGAVFDRTPNGLINQRNFGGHTYPRLAHVGDRTGLEMIRTLQDKLVHMAAEIFMETTVTHLFKTSDKICGCLTYSRVTGEFHLFRAKAIVLATGGGGKAFAITSNSWEYSGDGQALAWRAGAELMDMEFIQFHPTGMVWPLSVRGTLVTEGVRGEGGVLLNKDGRRFMFDYIPEAFKNDVAATEKEAEQWVAEVAAGKLATVRRPPELLTRDVVARSIRAEVQAGRGSPHGGAFLDIATRRTAADIQRKLPSMYHQFKQLANVDITKEPMEVGPTCHYMMGGVKVQAENGMSTVSGLFAAGEVAAGLHGANRLGGNSLSDLLVFGRRAGWGAAEYAKTASAPSVNEAEVAKAIEENLASLSRKGGENPYAVHKDLQDMMQDNVGIVRTEDELKQALGALDELEKRVDNVSVEGARAYNPGWNLAMDLRSLIVISRAVTLAALERRESRGGHSRIDFPSYDKKYSKVNHVLYNQNGQMALRADALPEVSPELKPFVEEA
ncbi:MAG: fumarate reductase/succinate dehydrogenase flavoprotein subunit [Calditrichaeota bacterium]|nr:fumarate reductase/succinate dehydrogenase flavoprotein subunit [Calditrichota bacterium]MCB9366310.1 fumarate reductase/succinate dehydrogenase flavoprotein subunit [Calditrichota bacterium]